MRNYLDAGNRERLYGVHGDCSDLLGDQDFDYDRASARILGRDIGRILAEETRPVIGRALSEDDET